jgi:hypothetical protein
MANVVYNTLKLGLAVGDINLSTDSFKVLLVTDVYTPDQDTHEDLADINAISGAEVASGGGYTTGGAALANVVVDIDLVNDRAYFTADDLTWATATITARGAIIYKDTGVAATSKLVCYKDFAANKTSSGGDFTIAWDATGILRIQ